MYIKLKKRDKLLKEKNFDRTHVTTFKLTKPMNWTKSDQADSMVLHIIVSSSVSLARQLGPSSQAADDNQGQYGESEDARNDRYDNRFG